MSELKAYSSERIYWAVEQVEREAGDVDDLHLDYNLFYLKYEADKVIARHKYKRCLAMAWWCSAELGMLVSTWQSKIKYYKRWQKRWLKLAEKFKEVK